MAYGTVTHFNKARGYGFIETTDADEDVFIHVSDIEGQSLDEGTELAFDIETNSEGLRARNPERLTAEPTSNTTTGTEPESETEPETGAQTHPDTEATPETTVAVSDTPNSSLADRLVDKYPNGVPVDFDQPKYKQVADILEQVPELRGSDKESRSIVMNMVDTEKTTYYKGRSYFEDRKKTAADETAAITTVADTSQSTTDGTPVAETTATDGGADDLTLDTATDADALTDQMGGGLSPDMQELVAEKTADKLADKLFEELTSS